MVTLDDSNSFWIQVYVNSDHKNPPTCYDDCDKIDADYKSSHRIHQEYLGLCAFDFYQITELLIYHILGWNESAQQPRPEGGAFGVLDWSHSIEEQGQKTLHGHYILWVREWFPLLLGLQSNDLDIRDQSAKKLQKYIDTVLSTKLFAGSHSLIRDACDHECISNWDDIPIICNDQSIRNLHYKHGTTSFGTDKFLKCPDCGTFFNMDNLVDNVLVTWFGTKSNLEKKLKLAVKRYGAQIDIASMEREQTMRNFIVHTLCNLHASSHVQSCFKNGFECRNKILDHPCY